MVLVLVALTVIGVAAPERLTVMRVLAAGWAGGVVAAVVAATASRARRRAEQRQAQSLLDAIRRIDTQLHLPAEELQPVAQDDVAPYAVTPRVPSLGQVEGALTVLGRRAVRRVVVAHEQSRVRVTNDLFLHIARREALLVAQALKSLEELQGKIKDSDLLLRVFKVDNLVVRLARLVENLGILGGATSNVAPHIPVSVLNVLRSGLQAIRQYSRVKLDTDAKDPDLALPGHVGRDLKNLVAELVENATEYSSPTTQVVLKAVEVPEGLRIEVVDRGQPHPERLRQANRLLTSPQMVDATDQLRDGRIGLLVVATIANRYGIRVQLVQNPMGGTTAAFVIPRSFLIRPEPEDKLHLPVPPAPAPRAPSLRPVPPGAGVLPVRTPRPADEGQQVSAGALPPLPVRPTGGRETPRGQSPRDARPAVTDRPGLGGAFLGRRPGTAGPPHEQPPTASE